MAYSIPVIHKDQDNMEALLGYLDSDAPLFDSDTELSLLKTIEVLYSGTATIVRGEVDILEIIITDKE